MAAMPTDQLIDCFFAFAKGVASRTATSIDDEAVSAAHMLAQIPTIQEWVDDLLDTVGPDQPDASLRLISVPTAVIQSAGAAGLTVERLLVLLPILLELFKQIRGIRNAE